MSSSSPCFIKKSFTKKRRKSVSAGNKNMRKLIEADSKWETKLCQSVSAGNTSNKTEEKDELFMIYQSPRKKPRKHRSPVLAESPVFVPHRKSVLNRKIRTSDDEVGAIIFRDIPAVYLNDSYTDEHEDEEFRRKQEGAIKTYEPLAKRPKYTSRNGQGTSVDLSWNEFMANSRGENSKYPLTNLLNREVSSTLHQNKERLICSEIEYRRPSRKKTLRTQSQGIKVNASEENVTRSILHRPLGKRGPVMDEYSNPSAEDLEFEKGGKRGGRMSLSEFRHVRRMKKQQQSNNRPIEVTSLIGSASADEFTQLLSNPKFHKNTEKSSELLLKDEANVKSFSEWNEKTNVVTGLLYKSSYSDPHTRARKELMKRRSEIMHQSTAEVHKRVTSETPSSMSSGHDSTSSRQFLNPKHIYHSKSPQKISPFDEILDKMKVRKNKSTSSSSTLQTSGGNRNSIAAEVKRDSEAASSTFTFAKPKVTSIEDVDNYKIQRDYGKWKIEM